MSRLVNLRVECNRDHARIDGRPYYVPKHVFIGEIQPRGSNGIVFETYDQVLERKDAVKIWVPIEGDLRNRGQQALAEARKVARLNHKNIVQIYGCDQFDNGWIYAIMELIDGTTLRDYLRSQRPEFVERARIWSAIVEAMEHAHEHNVYHGDLHAGNVMLFGRDVKVIDFGTSIFVSKKVSSRMRETRVLLELRQKLFPEPDPILSEITDIELPKLKPELALSALSTWVSIMRHWPDIIRTVRSNQHDKLYRFLMHLAFDIASVPVFSVSKLAEKLVKTGISVPITLINGIKINSVDLFVGFCVHWAQVRLSNSSEGMNSIPLNLQPNEILLKTLWPELQHAFLKSGPFD